MSLLTPSALTSLLGSLFLALCRIFPGRAAYSTPPTLFVRAWARALLTPLGSCPLTATSVSGEKKERHIDYKPFYRCLYIYDVLDQRHEFETFYTDSRSKQVLDIVLSTLFPRIVPFVNFHVPSTFFVFFCISLLPALSVLLLKAFLEWIQRPNLPEGFSLAHLCLSTRRAVKARFPGGLYQVGEGCGRVGKPHTQGRRRLLLCCSGYQVLTYTCFPVPGCAAPRPSWRGPGQRERAQPYQVLPLPGACACGGDVCTRMCLCVGWGVGRGDEGGACVCGGGRGGPCATIAVLSCFRRVSSVFACM